MQRNEWLSSDEERVVAIVARRFGLTPIDGEGGFGDVDGGVADGGESPLERARIAAQHLGLRDRVAFIRELVDTLPPGALGDVILSSQARMRAVLRFDILSALPLELLYKVFSYLDVKQLPKNVLLVCKAWHSLVEGARMAGLFPNGDWQFGVDDGLLRPLEIDTAAFDLTPSTFECFIKIPKDYGDQRVGVICGNYPSTRCINWEVHVNGNPRILWNDDLDWKITDEDLRTGRWEHIAFVRNSSKEFRFYRNGNSSHVKRCRTTPLSGESTLASSRNRTWMIGGDRRPRQKRSVFHGCIRDLYVWAEPRSAVQIRTSMLESIDRARDSSSQRTICVPRSPQLLCYFPMSRYPNRSHHRIVNFANQRGEDLSATIQTRS